MKDWIIGKILYVKDIKGPSGLLTFQGTCNKLGNSPNRILQFKVARAAVNTFVHSVDGWDTVGTELSDLPSFCNRQKTQRKTLERRLFQCTTLSRVQMVFGTENLEQK